MSEMNATDLERLVEVIARQVKARLGTESLPMPSGVTTCETPGCTTCTATSAECTGAGRCASVKTDVVKHIIANGADRVGAAPGVGVVDPTIAGMIDHTLLKPDATKEKLEQLCKEAVQYGFATVCVNSANIPFVARLLKGTPVKPIAVVGFPLGASLTSAKAYEAREAIRNGAREIDMVINVGALKSRDYATVVEDIKRVVEASRPYPVKVIIETGLLTDEEKVIACTLAKAGGAHFVKTSTGFGPGGATVEDVRLMRRVVGKDMAVKASGGIHSLEEAVAMKKAGADRIGASASVAIVTGKKPKKSKGY